MVRILVIGGTGYLGRLLVPSLVQCGHEVTVLSLDQEPPSAHTRHVPGSRHDKTLLRQLSEETPFDGIVDLIAYHEADVAGIVETWKGASHRLRRYVLLSTLAAVGGFRSPLANEDSAIAIKQPDTDYATGKAACERTLLSAAWHGFPGVILRSAPVFGPGDAVSRENYVVQRLLLGMPIPCTSPTNASVVRVFARDLIQAIASCFTRPLPAGRSYHLVQRENVSFEHYVRSIAELIGCPARLEPVRCERVEKAGINAAALPLGGIDPTIRFSIDRAVAELGFRPTPFPRALRETIESIQAVGAFEHPAWPGRGGTQSRLAGTQQHLQLEAERELWGAECYAVLDDDEIIRSLVEGSCATVLSNDWPALARLEPGTQTDEVVILPESLRDWISVHPKPIRRNCRPVLQAAIEPIRGPTGTEFHLYSRALRRRARGYAFTNSPVTLSLCPFCEFGSAPGPRARLLLAVRDKSDADALIEWLERCDREQSVLIPDIHAFSRIHLVDSVGWTSLTGGTGWQAKLRVSLAERNPRLGQWCGVFEACRRLRQQVSDTALVGPIRLTGDSLLQARSGTAVSSDSLRGCATQPSSCATR